MKKIVFGLISLFLVSQLFVSCSSESDVMSQFSKRKYLKKFKDKNVNDKNNIEKYDNSIDYNTTVDEYASLEVKPTDYKLNEIEANDNSIMIEFDEEQTEQQSIEIKDPTTDYSEWNKYNHKMNFSKWEDKSIKNVNSKNSVINNSQVDEIVLVILCIFIPPLAVYLFENSITTNFWVDLILSLLFWFPGMIFAFLVCFAGISL